MVVRFRVLKAHEAPGRPKTLVVSRKQQLYLEYSGLGELLERMWRERDGYVTKMKDKDSDLRLTTAQYERLVSNALNRALRLGKEQAL